MHRPPMSTFVLIHGSWGGGWVWERVVPLLERVGHTVVAPDLPGHGGDRTPIADITLERYVQRVLEVLDVQTEPVVLVGHSHGGVVVTQAAEARPEHVRRLVYVCAYLPRDGESLLTLAERDPEPERNLLPYLRIDEERGVASIADEGLRASMCQDGSEADLALLRKRLEPLEPLSSPGTPVHVTASRYGRIPRVYITCLEDRAISPALQRLMWSATPCEQVLEIRSGHMPMLTAPDEVAAHLLSVG